MKFSLMGSVIFVFAGLAYVLIFSNRDDEVPFYLMGIGFFFFVIATLIFLNSL